MIAITTYKDFLKERFKVIRLFYLVFYSVGIFGLMLPWTFAIFVKLIPFALLLSFAGIYFFHAEGIDKRTTIAFASIYFTGFFIEVIGVNTGFVFGNYHYGSALGLKLFGTPLMIGLNWLLLVYVTANIAEKIVAGAIPQIIIASSIMLVYDLILEQVAPVLDMWHWANGVPLQNYAAWLVIAIIFQSGIKVFKINTTNKLAPVILFCQIIFFTILFIYYLIH